MLIAMKVAPRGLPTCRKRACGVWDCCWRGEEDWWEGFEWGLVMEVFNRKSWVTAMPIEAKEREVRSQARKVRSGDSVSCCIPLQYIFLVSDE